MNIKPEIKTNWVKEKINDLFSKYDINHTGLYLGKYREISLEDELIKLLEEELANGRIQDYIVDSDTIGNEEMGYISVSYIFHGKLFQDIREWSYT